MSRGRGGERAPAGWHAWLLGGLLPVLLSGFAASALADRLAFAGWALAAACGYAAALRWSWGAAPASRRPLLRRGLPLAALALAAAAFAALAAAYREDLRLGVAAMLPPVPLAAAEVSR